MMRIVHIRSHSIFQPFNKSSSPDSGSESVVQLFWCTVPRWKPILYLLLNSHEDHSHARQYSRSDFRFPTPFRHACSVYNCFLLLFCSGDSKSSIPYFFSFIHCSPSVVVISLSSTSEPSSPIKECLYGEWRCAHNAHISE